MNDPNNTYLSLEGSRAIRSLAAVSDKINKLIEDHYLACASQNREIAEQFLAAHDAVEAKVADAPQSPDIEVLANAARVIAECFHERLLDQVVAGVSIPDTLAD